LINLKTSYSVFGESARVQDSGKQRRKPRPRRSNSINKKGRPDGAAFYANLVGRAGFEPATNWLKVGQLISN
jgi:hypothetical protein